MYSLPTQITIADKNYAIRNNGDYRMVLDCFLALNDEEIEESYRVLICLVIFYDCVNDIEELDDIFGDNIKIAIEEMFKFFNCGDSATQGAKVQHNVVDWEADSQLIVSAINNVARTEIRALEYLHWWTFMGYYMAVGESAFSTVVSIRTKIAKGKKLEDYEKDFKKDNPQYFKRKQSKEEQELTDYINNLWNGD